MPSYTPKPYWRFVVLDAITTSGTPATTCGVAFVDAFQNQHGDAVYYRDGPTITGASGGFTNAVGNLSSAFVRPNSIGGSLVGVFQTGWRGTGYVQFQSDNPVWVDRVHWYNDSYSGAQGWASHIKALSSDDGVLWTEEWSATYEPVVDGREYLTPIVFKNPSPVGTPKDASLRLSGANAATRYYIDPAKSCSDTGGLVPCVDGDPVASIVLSGNGPTTLLVPPVGSRPIYRSDGIKGRPYLDVERGQWLGTVNAPMGSGVASVSNPYAITFAVQNTTPNPTSFWVCLSNYSGRDSSKGLFFLRPVRPAGNQLQMVSNVIAGTLLSGFRTVTSMLRSYSDLAFLCDTKTYAAGASGNFPSTTDTNLEILRGGGVLAGADFKGEFYGAVMTTEPSKADGTRAALWSDGKFYGEFGIATSYDNPGGSGERRQGIYYAWWDATFNHSGRYALNFFNGDIDSNFYPGPTAGECSIVFDFMAPRVIDEMRVVLSEAGGIGAWAFEASHDLVTWDVLTPAFTQSVSVPTWPAHGNATAYRYYRLHRPSGTTSTRPYWRRAEFRIDGIPSSDGWFSPLSAGDRSSQIVVTGGYWSSVANAPQVITREVCTLTTDAYFSSGSSGECQFTFAAPVALTGFMWWWQSYVSQGVHTLEASNDGLSWDTLIESFDFYPRERASSTGIQMPWFGVEWENETEYSIYRLRVVSGSRTSAPNSGIVNFKVAGGSGPVEVVIYPSSGSLILTGSVPEVLAAIEVDALTGSLVLTGGSPSVHTETIVAPSRGFLKITGGNPLVSVGSFVTPSPDVLVLTGLDPIVYTESGAVSSQSAILALGVPPPPSALSSQIAVMAVAEPPAPPVAASQAAVMAIGEIIPEVHASQAAIIVLGFAEPFVTRRADIWIIRRRDGVVLGFTSHDEPIQFGGVKCSPCKSLDPTATEQASQIGEVSNMDLQGLISDDRITEADLYGGLYDDAFVEVWRVPWGGAAETPVRLAAGWCGELQHGGASFKMEVFGPAVRLSQQALVQPYAPACNREFGSPLDQLPPGGCGVNAEARKITASIVKTRGRADYTISQTVDPETAPMWENGRMRFLSGPNVGVIREVNSVHWPTGRILLQVPPPFLPEVGDTFDLLPGCDQRAETCKLYENYINFGGFPDVPGTDSIGETPDAKY